MINQKIKTVSIFGITHMLVDAACVFTLFFSIQHNQLENSLAFTLIVLYNLLAFGIQSLIGDYFDKKSSPKTCAVIGCILTALSPLLWKYSFIAALCAGVGNAFFHVGGGITCLKLAKGKATIPGIYVAPGALGLFIGACAAKNEFISPIVPFIFLIICSAIIFINKNSESIETPFYKDTKPNILILILNFLLLSIVIRSFIGLSISLDWKENILLLFLLTLAVVFGKMSGGIISDKFGWIKVTVLALLISSPLIAFGINNPILFIIGTFFFNFTMPVTLTAISNLLKGREGFAFGLTTLALITGAFPFFTGMKLTVDHSFIIFGIITVSAILIYYGLKQYDKIIKSR